MRGVMSATRSTSRKNDRSLRGRQRTDSGNRPDREGRPTRGRSIETPIERVEEVDKGV